MPELTSQIPFMASLWIRSGYDVKVEGSAQTYQVGAHIKAFNEPILMAPSDSRCIQAGLNFFLCSSVQSEK